MSKPIKLTDELYKNIMAEFSARVKAMKMFDGKLEYSRTFKWDDSENDRATIYLSSVAFAKMNALIQQFDTEVAWHGVVHRDPDNPTVFRITDILVYPQTVSGATVNTNQEAYQTWLYSFDDEIFDNIRMQGHSHVNMSTSPSPVDTTNQERILSQIKNDDYYIFMIWNKRYDHWVCIFDMSSNTLYEKGDIDVLIGDEGVNLKSFIEDSKKVVTSSYSGGTTTYQSPQSSKVQAVAPAQTTTPSSSNSNLKSKPKTGGVSEIGTSYQNYRYGGSGWNYDPPYRRQ